MLREDAELTQDQVTDALAALGVTIGRSYISEIERSKKMPNGEVIAGLARVLRTTADYLLCLSESPDAPGDAAPVAGMSAEADEIARIVDALQPEMRAFVLHMARSLAAYMAGTAQVSPDIERVAPGVGGRWFYSVKREPEGAD